MHIDSFSLFHVALPRKKPQFIAGRPSESLETVLVKLTSGSAVGWGEAAPGNAPTSNSEWAAGAFAVLRDWLAPAVVKTEIDSGKTLAERLAPFRGNQHAKAALDNAWWDLSARSPERPLHSLLGAKRQAVEIGPCLDQMESPDAFMTAIAAAFEAGFRRVKLKIRPGWALEMLRGVRQEFPGETFHIDCEGALSLGYMEMLYRFDDFGLEMVEQPLAADDLVAHAMLQESLRTPICLDESIASLLHAEMAFDLKSCRHVNLKAGRVGGLTAALTILEACEAADVSCWGGASAQSAIGARADLALAARTSSDYPADFFPSESELAEDLAEPLHPLRDAGNGGIRIALAAESGLGVVPDAALLERLAMQKVEM
ncbi:MAG: enolase C-terminal domain-like protein [Thermoguttaceae bacterium]